VEGFMSRQPVAYLLFGAGAAIALVMEMLGVPALIFALGMYLPLELNLPALVGGALSHFLNKRTEQQGRPGIRERGVIIASGLMAGGALGGVFGASLRLIPGFTHRSTTSIGSRRAYQPFCLSAFASMCGRAP